jgi:phosphoglycolate phosphatase-like HAD superfamily hydrolase
VSDLLTRIEHNRFAGREFLLWVWFESVLFETNLKPTGHASCALWLETRMTLSFDKDETLLKTATPGTAAEAREALRQGKLPREARIRLTTGDREYAWLFKADTLSLSGLTVPGELDIKKDELAEVLYERMRLVEELEATLAALFRDYLALRLYDAWATAILPALGRFAHDEPVNEDAYTRAKQQALVRKARKAS